MRESIVRGAEGSSAQESAESLVLEFQNVSKQFGKVRAVDEVSLGVRPGEFLSLLGPSGCGKTTLLRLAAGFETPDRGRILLDAVDLTGLPPNRRRVNTIFQNYALFPHLTVRENIEFGPRTARWPATMIAGEVEKMLHLIQMVECADKRPDQLSGGQKQRVAVARALINKPRVLLLDEPLAALDLKLRQRMLIELGLIQEEMGITFLYVTHDQGEALSLSDRVAVMNRGRIEQVGAPQVVYESPHSAFVAAFIGDTNFLEGEVVGLQEGDYGLCQLNGLPPLAFRNGGGTRVGDTVRLSVRPEKLRLSRSDPRESLPWNVLPGTIEEVAYLGTHTRYWVRVGEQRLAVFRQHSQSSSGECALGRSDHVWVQWNAEDCFVIEPSGERAGLETGPVLPSRNTDRQILRTENRGSGQAVRGTGG